MIQHIKGNWLFYIIAVGVTIIVIWALGRYLKSTPPLPHDTFYYRVIDTAGNTSCNHDSGIRPSKTPEGSIIQLQILKKEYNDGKSTTLAYPATIKLGMHYQDMKWSLQPQNIQDNGLYYTVDIVIPKNSLYGTNIQSHIDFREEVSSDIETPVP